MAKRKIIWSDTARSSFKEILDYYRIRNGNNKYSKSLSDRIKTTISHLRVNNYIGKNSTFEDVRVIISENYEIFYSLNDKEIMIEIIWDSRRNPDDLKLRPEA